MSAGAANVTTSSPGEDTEDQQPTPIPGRATASAAYLPAPSWASPRPCISSTALPVLPGITMAAQQEWVTIDKRPGGYALVMMAREPVNTLTLALWQQLAQAVRQCEQDPSIRGIIIASGLQRDIFTAGNDIVSLYAPKSSREQYGKFWVVQNQFLASLYRSPLITVAAIRGACPAAGCNIALCCDHRIMTEQGYIGLNEVAIGISVPEKWCDLMGRTIGQGPASQLLQFAQMPSSQDALKLGLVDRLVPTEQLLPTAEQTMQQLLKVPDKGRQRTKGILRDSFAKEWEEFCVPEVEGAWEMLASPEISSAVGATLQRLAGKKKAKL